jgi:hypothetical protein
VRRARHTATVKLYGKFVASRFLKSASSSIFDRILSLTMSGKDRERRAQAASSRTYEYFVPKDCMDREVITAEICLYLGADALVRLGTYVVS